MTFTPNTVFAAVEKAGASDVHIAVGSPLIFRIEGVLTPQGGASLSKT
ncbi:MAG: hypothetical protein O2904_02565 [bacterium]|nr:hypothetical protein [bacterium]